MVRLGLRSGEIVRGPLSQSIQADVEFIQRKVMLDACALDLVLRVEGMPVRAHMLAPGRRRRREWLIRPERHAPFAAVVALLPVDKEGLLGLSSRRQDQRLAGSSRIRFRSGDERCRQQSPRPIKKCRRSSIIALLQFAHASESKDQLLPAWATSSFTTVAGQGWLAGLAEPALDAARHIAAMYRCFKPTRSQTLRSIPNERFLLPGWLSCVLAAMPENAALCGGMG